MKLGISFPGLDGLIQRMGAQRSTWRPRSVEISSREGVLRALNRGVEILPEERRHSRRGDLLTYEGEQVVLYIKDVRKDEDNLRRNLEDAPRIHIVECRTLEEMRHYGRFSRYIYTNSVTGEFWIEARNQITNQTTSLQLKLHVCKHCLREINWNGYAELESPIEKNEARDSFSLSDFFAEFATFFSHLPRFNEFTAPRGGYTKDWPIISWRIREEENFICQMCKVDLSSYPRLLHCHHKNGVTSDNSRSNIEVLCLLCHSEKPFHGRLKGDSNGIRTIENFRHEQGIE